jgi:hypothetical protein
MPRHHNIIRFRMGRPFRHNINPNVPTPADYMQMMFRDSCHWNTFTLNWVDWVYEYFVLDPPTPINCPIQGRYRFIQHGEVSEQYYTKIPMGVTPRPRVQVLFIISTVTLMRYNEIPIYPPPSLILGGVSAKNAN